MTSNGVRVTLPPPLCRESKFGFIISELQHTCAIVIFSYERASGFKYIT